MIQVGDYHLKTSCELCGGLVYHSVSHPSTNRAQCGLTLVIDARATLPLLYVKIGIQNSKLNIRNQHKINCNYTQLKSKLL